MPSASSASSCLVLQDSKQKTDISNVSLTFQALTKSTGKAFDQVQVLKVLHSHRRDIHVSPLLPATWAITFSIKPNVDNKFFSSNKFNVFKNGKTLPGIIQYTLDNVLLMESIDPHYESVPLQQI
jgi:hypothetical protein